MKRSCDESEEEGGSSQALVSISGRQNANLTKGVLFAGGSAIEFSIAREAIISQFKMEQCWDMVELPANPTDPIVETPGPTEEKPSEEALARRLNELRDLTRIATVAETRAMKEDIAAQDPANFASADAVTNEHPLVRDLRTRLARIEKSREDHIIGCYENKEWLRTWESANDRWKNRCKSCDKVFRTCLSLDVLHSIQQELDTQAFRAAWKKLHDLYLTYDGDTKHASLHILFQLLADTKFNDSTGSIPNHFANMKRLFDEGEKLGVHFDEDHRIYHICQSFDHNSIYNDVISNAKLNRKSLDQLKAQLLSAHNTWKANTSKGRLAASFSEKRHKLEDHSSSPSPSRPYALISNEKAKRTDSNSTVCQICNKVGHSASKCWHFLPCSKCGKPGHSSRRCRQEMPLYTNNEQPTNNPANHFKKAHLLNEGK